MPYTSHGHPYGSVSPDEPHPVLVAKCGGPGLCPVCRAEAAEPVADAHAERMADAYNLGIKAEALREFADQLDAMPRRNETMTRVAVIARSKAQDLDAEAEQLAGRLRIADTPEAGR